MKRIEVTHLHAWAAGFLKRQGLEVKVASDTEQRALMARALDQIDAELPHTFYLDEWERVVLAQEVETRDQYLTARRTGRGTRLGRRQRLEVWKVLARYRELLDEQGHVEWDDVLKETRRLLERGSVGSGISAVLADEVQDLTPSALRLLKAIPSEDHDHLFLVGDGHQRIYGQPATLRSCGIDIRGRAWRLKLNYRTTAQIRAYAAGVLENVQVDDLDGGIDTLQGYHSVRHGPVPAVLHFEKEAQEAEGVVRAIEKWLETTPAEEICLTARTHKLLKERYRPIFESRGIETCLVETDPESEARKPGVRLATMHRLKGLEFPRVLVAGVSEGIVPLESDSLGGDLEQVEEHRRKERCLFYVATTRARDELVVTGFGRKSSFLQ
jgi:superfamily I DNA/RNA helicase